jgi:hypothetical protein
MSTLAVWYAVFGFGILGLLIFACWVIGLVDILKRRDLDRAHRSAWILVVVLLPLIGTAWYFIQRPTPEADRQKMVDAEMQRHRR